MKKATRKRATTRKKTPKKRTTARGQRSLPLTDAAVPTAEEQAAHREQTALVKKILECRRKAKAFYKESEILMEQLVDEAGVGTEFDLGRGRTAVLTDQFSRRRTQFKTVGFDRYDLDVME